MDYRAPLAGLERRLGDLEEELARLRALPPRKRKGPPRVSKKERALEKRLASLDEALANSGVRELTERETGTLQRMARMGVAFILCGLAIASLHLVLRGGEAMSPVWLIASAISVLLGVGCVLAALNEAQKRRKGIIAADVFPDSD